MNYKKFLSKFMALSLALSSCPAAAVIADTAKSTGLTALAEDAAQVTITGNQFQNDYLSKANPVKSYLNENEDGTFTRVEYYDAKKSVIIENFSFKDGEYKLLSAKTLPNPMQLWGGCFFGENANFLVFADNNIEEDKTKEIFRVIKYSKDWEELDSLSISNINTSIPMRSASLRMLELNGQLFIYTSHQLLKTYDGLNHQSNLTIVVDEEKMAISQKFDDILNVDAGYISHSFNEFIATDGESIYRVDHGDAYPRSISLLKCPPNSIKKVKYKDAYEIAGVVGANKTGVSIGGFELSADNCIIVGNTVDMSNYNPDGVRNIFINITDKDLNESKTIMVTSFMATEKIDVFTPHLVKKDDNNFVVMWTEMTNNKDAVTRYVCIDGNGEFTSEIGTMDTNLSDCKPIVLKNGKVSWYVTDGKTLKFTQTNPFNVPEGGATENPTNPDKPNDPAAPPAASVVDYSKPFKDKLNEIISSDSVTDLSYSLTDIDGDGTPELIVTTGKGSKDERVDVYKADPDSGEAKNIGSVSGTNTAVLTDSASGALVIATEKDGEITADKYIVSSGKLEPAKTGSLVVDKAEDKAPAEQLSATGSYDRVDTVEMNKTDKGWESVKDIVADHAPVKSEGTDMSLFDDYAEEQKKPQYVDGYKDIITSAVEKGESKLEYGLADLNGDGVPELIVVTDGDDPNEKKVTIYTPDKETGKAVMVICISGEGLEARVNTETGNIVFVQVTETSIAVNEVEMKDGIIDPTNAITSTIDRVKGEDTDVTLSKELPVSKLDTVAIEKTDKGWESVKDIVADHSPVKSEGTDMSLFDDYAEEQKKPDYVGGYKDAITGIINKGETKLEYSVTDIDGDGSPELIVVTDGEKPGEKKVIIYTPDKETGSAVQVISISGKGLDVRVNTETGNIVFVQVTETSIVVNEVELKDGIIDPTKAVTSTVDRVKGEDTDVTLSKELPIGKLDSVELEKTENGWESTKNEADVNEPIKSLGTDMSLIDDYAEDQKKTDYQKKYEAELKGLAQTDVTTIEYIIADLDGNGIPEMIVKYGKGEADLVTKVFTVNGDGKLVSCGELPGGHTTYMIDNSTNQLVTVWSHLGDVAVTWYEFTNNEIKPVKGSDVEVKLGEDQILESVLPSLGDFATPGKVTAVKSDGVWRSTKEDTANHEPISSTGVDLSLIADYIRKEAALGDVNGDGFVNASDASSVLVEYSLLSTGQSGTFTGTQVDAADVDKNGKVDAADASTILVYYSYASTGGTASMAEFMRK